jgi:hypothetical protein
VTTTAIVRTAPKCDSCQQVTWWCNCMRQPAKFYTRRGRDYTFVLMWCRHTAERGEICGRFPAGCGLTQKEMVRETAKMAPEPYCPCIVALLEEQEKV